jgi:uroporphyrinogen-III synthase
MENGKWKMENGKLRNIFDIPALCIGPITANAARDAGFINVHFPAEYTAAGMVAMLSRLMADS